ncbi:MAG: OPT/YSL family transporter [Myxococcota bacterium]|nr:OPT/YSL family transporter [Myxococcota bacterium]
MSDSAPTHAPYRELTVAAVVLGVIIGALMTAAFVYIALKLGFGLGGSTVAAILGFAVLRGALKSGTIVENNINQTVASGINIASSGVVFTFPALFLLAEKDPSLQGFSWQPFVLSAMAGSFMGILLIIPLRKQMIEFERLNFPSGIAVSKLLKSPGAGLRQGILLLSGFAISALFTALQELHIAPHDWDIGAMMGLPVWFPVAIYLSFANLGAGLLSGKGGLPYAAGGILAWWIVSPIMFNAGWLPAPEIADQAAWQKDIMYGTMIRPVGIGMLVGGALMGVILSFPALKSAIRSLSVASQLSANGGPSSQEMSTKVLGLGAIAAVLALFIAALLSSDQVTLTQAAATAVAGAIWLGLAGLVVAQATGMTDISPMSGMSLIAVTLIFFITAGNVVVSILLGVAICIGIGQCADMMQDLKTGHLVGSTPKRQQLAQFAVAWIGGPIAVGTVFLLWGEGGGFGPGTDLAAPQADALSAIIESLRGGDVPLDRYVAGAVLGCALSAFPVGGLGVLVGLAMYLPVDITFGYGIGCLASMALQRKLGKRWIGETLVPVAAGFIVGEALTSLGFTLVRLISGGA